MNKFLLMMLKTITLESIEYKKESHNLLTLVLSHKQVNVLLLTSARLHMAAEFFIILTSPREYEHELGKYNSPSE